MGQEVLDSAVSQLTKDIASIDGKTAVADRDAMQASIATAKACARWKARDIVMAAKLDELSEGLTTAEELKNKIKTDADEYLKDADSEVSKLTQFQRVIDDTTKTAAEKAEAAKGASEIWEGLKGDEAKIKDILQKRAVIALSDKLQAEQVDGAKENLITDKKSAIETEGTRVSAAVEAFIKGTPQENSAASSGDAPTESGSSPKGSKNRSSNAKAGDVPPDPEDTVTNNFNQNIIDHPGSYDDFLIGKVEAGKGFVIDQKCAKEVKIIPPEGQPPKELKGGDVITKVYYRKTGSSDSDVVSKSILSSEDFDAAVDAAKAAGNQRISLTIQPGTAPGTPYDIEIELQKKSGNYSEIISYGNPNQFELGLRTKFRDTGTLVAAPCANVTAGEPPQVNDRITKLFYCRCGQNNSNWIDNITTTSIYNPTNLKRGLLDAKDRGNRRVSIEFERQVNGETKTFTAEVEFKQLSNAAPFNKEPDGNFSKEVKVHADKFTTGLWVKNTYVPGKGFEVETARELDSGDNFVETGDFIQTVYFRKTGGDDSDVVVRKMEKPGDWDKASRDAIKAGNKRISLTVLKKDGSKQDVEIEFQRISIGTL